MSFGSSKRRLLVLHQLADLAALYGRRDKSIVVFCTVLIILLCSEMDSVDEEEDEEDIPETVSDSQLIAHEGLSDKLNRRAPSRFIDDNSDMEEDEGPVSPFDGHPMWRRV